MATFLASLPADGPLVVCDPVMVTTSGSRLLDEDATSALTAELFPHCRLITPNLVEAEALVGRRLRTPTDVERAAAELLAAGRCTAVLIKGGHTAAAAEDGGPMAAAGVVQDYFLEGSAMAEGLCAGGWWLSGERIASDETHGTGCTLSSAIAALLARRLPLLDALVLAKAYVAQGIRAAVRLGGGPGPVAHTRWPYQPESMPWLSREALDGAVRPEFARCTGDAARGLLPVVDSASLVARVVACGVKDVQLRLKGRAHDEIAAEVHAAQAACEAHGARLWVNDHWRVAVAHGAYGVHVGQEDLAAMAIEDVHALASSGTRLGISTHSYAELAIALAVRPSYISLGVQPMSERRTSAHS